MQPESSRRQVETNAETFVVKDGTYHTEAPCRKCGESGKIKCYPGAWAQCWNCGAKLLYLGRVPEASCVSPSGRIDVHMKRVKFVDGQMVCNFCNTGAT